MGCKSSKTRFNPLNHSYQYDMIIIGGGSGGIACAREAAKYGAKVAICDFVVPTPNGTKWGLGGTCVNVGCIPKRLMHQSNLIKDFMGDASLFGWAVPEISNVKWETLIENIQDYINFLNFNYRMVFSQEKITLFKGLASFKNEHEINILHGTGEEEVISGQCIVIAVGGRPKYLNNIPGGSAEDNLCITSDDIFSLPYPPGKTLCIGAGYISVECAGFLAGFGYDVTIMARSSILRGFDKSIVDLITENLVGRTVAILKNAQPKEIKLVKPGQPPTLSVSYQFNEKGPVAEVECNTVLLAIGRKPCTRYLNLENVPGIKTDAEGYIITDQYECTNVPHIFAIGDCAKGRPQLTPPAVQAGHYLARRIYKESFSLKVDYESVPTAIFTPIEYGCCGLSEEEAIQKFGAKKVDVYEKAAVPLEFSFNKRDGEAIFAKLICLRSKKKGEEKVVGFHYLGPNAADITVGFSLLIKQKCSKSQLDDLVGIHPTSAEIFTQMNSPRSAGLALRDSGC